MAKADQVGWHHAKPGPSSQSAGGASTISCASRTLLEQEVQDRYWLLPGLEYWPKTVVGSQCFCSLRLLTEKSGRMPVRLEEWRIAAFVVMDGAIEATGVWAFRLDSNCMS